MCAQAEATESTKRRMDGRRLFPASWGMMYAIQIYLDHVGALSDSSIRREVDVDLPVASGS